MNLISSRDNPLYKKLHKIAEDARESRKQGQTLIDGPHLVAAYRQQVGLPELLLLNESSCENSEIQSLVDKHSGTNIFLLKDSLFKTLASVESPVGVASLISIPKKIPAFDDGSCILLDTIQDPGNVGSILRSSAAAGVGDIFLGPGCASVWSPRVMRAAQGAHFRLRIRESADLAQFLRHYSGKSLTTVVSGGIPLYSAPRSGNIAWVFGSEGNGVSSALISLASHLVTIPMAAETESLNVAAAAAICLFARSEINQL
jgi:RNA methyltransferase, TrmH family